MTVLMNDILLDAQADKLIADGNAVHLLTAPSLVYATVIADSFGTHAPSFTKGDYAGAGGGRSAILGAEVDVAINTDTNHAGADVTFTNFAIVDTVNTVVLYVGQGTGKLLSNGDKVNTPAAKVNTLDAVVTP